MPVLSAMNDDKSFLVMRFFGKVSMEQILAADAASAEQLTHSGPFVTLLIFETPIDLSTLDTAALNAIRKSRAGELRSHGLKRRAGAAVYDSSVQASVILRLWNALCDCDSEQDLHFELFESADQALDWLGIAADAAEGVIEQTDPTSQALSNG